MASSSLLPTAVHTQLANPAMISSSSSSSSANRQSSDSAIPSSSSSSSSSFSSFTVRSGPLYYILFVLLLALSSFPAAVLASESSVSFQVRVPSSPSSTPSPSSSSSFRFAKAAYQIVTPTVDVRYHNGPVLTPKIKVFLIWYGRWQPSQQSIIRDFLNSIAKDSASSSPPPSPSVSEWWSTVQLYTDQTGAHISDSLKIVGEATDLYSHGKILTRMTTQEVIKNSLKPFNGTLPVAPRGGIYMVLTSEDVVQQDFCSAACGFHYFTYSSIVGFTLPYAWIGNSAKQCPETCAYPFAVPFYMAESIKPMKSPNGNIGVDGMISVIGHELAEMSSNPLINAWFAGTDPMAPTEIADLCEGMYGPGAGGGYAGTVSQDQSGASFNVNGVNGRRFLIQWLWNNEIKACRGPNASA